MNDRLTKKYVNKIKNIQTIWFFFSYVKKQGKQVTETQVCTNLSDHHQNIINIAINGSPPIFNIKNLLSLLNGIDLIIQSLKSSCENNNNFKLLGSQINFSHSQQFTNFLSQTRSFNPLPKNHQILTFLIRIFSSKICILITS